jgi:uncharacterized short protein YbdD (DUF466 family)
MSRKELKHGVKRLWDYLRQVTGDDAYERYLAHQQHAHPGEPLLTRQGYFKRRQEEKWGKVSRCC